MYTPRHFAATSDEHALRIVREHPFATLITTAENAEPQITHLPLMFEDEFLWGHVARANPHAAVLTHGHTLAIFNGPHQYISPRWYDKPDDNVPTWNYAAVHVHGQPEILDVAGARRVIERLTAHYENGQWAPPPQKLERLLPAIVAFRLPMTRVEAKFKFNQNRTSADRAKVIATLLASGRAEDAAGADWIERCNE